MSEMKLTNWFPSKIKPVREGVYETKACYVRAGYSFWDGSAWGWTNDTVKQANRVRYSLGAYQYKKWRGVAK
jgi:hypothetical protein